MEYRENPIERTYHITYFVKGHPRQRASVMSGNLEEAICMLKISLRRKGIILNPVEGDNANWDCVTRYSVMRMPGKKVPERVFN